MDFVSAACDNYSPNASTLLREYVKKLGKFYCEIYGDDVGKFVVKDSEIVHVASASGLITQHLYRYRVIPTLNSCVKFKRKLLLFLKETAPLCEHQIPNGVCYMLKGDCNKDSHLRFKEFIVQHLESARNLTTTFCNYVPQSVLSELIDEYPEYIAEIGDYSKNCYNNKDLARIRIQFQPKTRKDLLVQGWSLERSLYENIKDELVQLRLSNRQGKIIVTWDNEGLFSNVEAMEILQAYHNKIQNHNIEIILDRGMNISYEAFMELFERHCGGWNVKFLDDQTDQIFKPMIEFAPSVKTPIVLVPQTAYARLVERVNGGRCKYVKTFETQKEYAYTENEDDVQQALVELEADVKAAKAERDLEIAKVKHLKGSKNARLRKQRIRKVDFVKRNVTAVTEDQKTMYLRFGQAAEVNEEVWKLLLEFDRPIKRQYLDRFKLSFPDDFLEENFSVSSILQLHHAVIKKTDKGELPGKVLVDRHHIRVNLLPMKDYKTIEEAYKEIETLHLSQNAHHPTPFISTLGTLEMMCDLWSCAMRYCKDFYEAYCMFITWIVDQEKGVYEVKEKFKFIDRLGLLMFYRFVYDNQISMKKYTYAYQVNQKRSLPLSEQALKTDWLKLIQETNNPLQSTFVAFDIPEVKNYVEETNIHVAIVNTLLKQLNMKQNHDEDKYSRRSIIAYTYNWYVKPKLQQVTETAFECSKCENPFPHKNCEDGFTSSLVSNTKKVLVMAKDKVKDFVPQAVIDLATSLKNQFSELSTIVKSMSEKVALVLKPILAALGVAYEASNIYNVLDLVKYYIMYINTSSLMIKWICIYSICSSLGILEKVMGALTSFLDTERAVDREANATETFAGLNILEHLSKMFDYLLSIDPKTVAIPLAFIIFMICGVKVASDKMPSLGKNFVESMKNMHFLGGGIIGVHRIFDHIVAAVKFCIEWIGKKFAGKVPQDEKEKAELEKFVFDYSQWSTEIKLLASDSYTSVLMSSKNLQDHVRILYFAYRKYRLKYLNGELGKTVERDFVTAERNMMAIYNIVTRATAHQDYRPCPYHIQFVGEKGSGKSHLMESLTSRFGQKYWSDRTSLVYTQPQGEFCDGYIDEPIWIFDDLWPADDYKMVLPLLTFFSNCPYQVPMARVEEKGRMLVSKLAISTTNTSHPTFGGIFDYKPLWRRRDLLIKVKCDSKVMDPQSGKFSAKLFGMIYKGKDSHDYPHLRFDLLDPMEQGRDLSEPYPKGIQDPTTDLTYTELINRMFAGYEAHMLGEEKFSDSVDGLRLKMRNDLLEFDEIYEELYGDTIFKAGYIENYYDINGTIPVADNDDPHELSYEDIETMNCEQYVENLGKNSKEFCEKYLELILDRFEYWTQIRVFRNMGELHGFSLCLYTLYSVRDKLTSEQESRVMSLLDRIKQNMTSVRGFNITVWFLRSSYTKPTLWQKEEVLKLVETFLDDEQYGFDDIMIAWALCLVFSLGEDLQSRSEKELAAFAEETFFRNDAFVKVEGTPTEMKEAIQHCLQELTKTIDEYKKDLYLSTDSVLQQILLPCLGELNENVTENQLQKMHGYIHSYMILKYPNAGKHTEAIDIFEEGDIDFSATNEYPIYRHLCYMVLLVQKIAIYQVEYREAVKKERMNKTPRTTNWFGHADAKKNGKYRLWFGMEYGGELFVNGNASGYVPLPTMTQFDGAKIDLTRSTSKKFLNFPLDEISLVYLSGLEWDGVEWLFSSTTYDLLSKMVGFMPTQAGKIKVTAAVLASLSQSFRDTHDAFFSLTQIQKMNILIWYKSNYTLIGRLKDLKEEIVNGTKSLFKKLWNAMTGAASWVWNKFKQWKKVVAIGMGAIAVIIVCTQFAKLFIPDSLPTSISHNKYLGPRVKGIAVQNSDQISKAIQDSVILCFIESGTAQAIKLCAKMLLIPFHAVSEYLGKKKDIRLTIQLKNNTYMTYEIPPSNFRRIKNSDACIVHHSEMPQFKDLRPYFMTAEDHEMEKEAMCTTFTCTNEGLEIGHYPYLGVQKEISTRYNSGLQMTHSCVGCMDTVMPVGHSGSIIVGKCVLSNTKRRIVGIQAFVQKDCSFFSVLCQEDIMELTQDLSLLYPILTGPILFDDKVPVSQETAAMIGEHLPIISGVLPSLRLMRYGRSDIERTPLAVKFDPQPRVPAILSSYDVKCYGNPIAHSINKHGRDSQSVLPKEFVKQAVEEYANLYIQQIGRPRVLSMLEAIEGNGLMPHMNLSTSPGLPWVHMKGTSTGKHQFLKIDETGKCCFVSESLQKCVEETIDCMEHGVIPPFQMMEVMKDELRPVAKAYGLPPETAMQLVEQHPRTWPVPRVVKTRSITVMPMEYTIIYRMYFGDLFSHLYGMADGLNEYCVGMNPDSPAAFRNLMACLRLNDKGFDVDVQNFDGHFIKQLADAVCDMCQRIYDDGPENYAIRRALVEAAWFGYVQYYDAVYQKQTGNPSGFPGTADFNTMAHIIIAFVIWLIIMQENQRYDMMNLRSKRLYSNDVFVGDDRKTVIARILEDIYNGITVSKWYTKFGWPTTSASKTGEVTAFKPLNELVFLKRTLIQDEFNPLYVKWALDKQVCRDLCSYVRKTKNPKQQFVENLYLALDYACDWGEDFYNEMVRIILDGLTGLNYQPILTTYTEMRRIKINRYKGESTSLSPRAELERGCSDYFINAAMQAAYVPRCEVN